MLCPCIVQKLTKLTGHKLILLFEIAVSVKIQLCYAAVGYAGLACGRDNRDQLYGGIGTAVEGRVSILPSLKAS